MNGECKTPEPTLCGCCAGVGPETPQPITNRPALPAIAYRVGTYAEFRASLLAELSDPANAALAPLRTRDDSDFTIALLDAWAVSADILSFYNERIANESYLRTALDRRSVFELARLVGYRPSPGVAASAFIAFALNDAPGSPDNVLIKAGSRVQSVPGPGQTPAVFETSNDITAMIASNAIPAQSTIPWALSTGDQSATFKGPALKVNPGDGILFVDSQLHSSLKTGAADFHFVTSATVDSKTGTTTIDWDFPLSSAFGTGNKGVFVYIFRKKAALFGAQAPDPRPLRGNPPNPYFTDPKFVRADTGDWLFQYTPGSMQINLDASYAGLAPEVGGEPQWIVFASPGGIALFQINAATETGPALYTLTSKTTQLTLALGVVLLNSLLLVAQIVLIQAFDAYIQALLSGASPSDVQAALDKFWEALGNYLAILAAGPTTADQVLALVVPQTRSTTAFVQSELLIPADPPFFGPWSFDGPFARQPGMLKPVEGPNLEIVGGQQLASGQPVSVSGQRPRLRVTKGAVAAFVPDGATGALAVADGQIFLVDAFPPRDSKWRAITTNGISGSLQTAASNITLLPADPSDSTVAESAVINQTSVAGSITTLSFDQPLRRIYDRATVTVNANTVAATHGETMHEILGSGDATNPALQFTLKQSPLTYVSSASSPGSSSTLQVWVNNLRWQENGNFLESGPADRVFITRMDDDQKVTVQFGDGLEGGRTPTGQMNIRAVYRKGIGSAGMVQAGQLSQPLDRPQGLKGAANPDAATGGADPDTADDARTSAPLHVLTLDRVVSLEDYLNYTRAFSGIAKALATWTWFGRTRGVFLTVAGANGATFNAGDPTIVNLTKALANAGNPFVPLLVDSYVQVLFEIGATVRVDSVNYDPDEVLGRVWRALSTAFSFANRDLGQGVDQSEVIEIIQQTAGVIAVELTAFGRSGDVPQSPLPAVLRAASPVAAGNSTPTAVEMLILDPASRGSIGAWS
ncbi:MAG TPA: hypothetical protein VGV35_16915 [Bryobacteraceae bacterium]|nr:hypothetical protein [Bryobacteraceae bacterium]